MKLSGILKACVVGFSLLTMQPALAESTQVAAAVTADKQAAQPVNINRADAATLAGSLKGIGMRKAEAIVAYRTEHGPFKSVDELANVKGIVQQLTRTRRVMKENGDRKTPLFITELGWGSDPRPAGGSRLYKGLAGQSQMLAKSFAGLTTKAGTMFQ